MDVRRGDTVVVLVGKDRGKRGQVERVEQTKRGFGIVVPGLNVAKKHQASAGRNRQGGILQIPMPIHVSNVQVVCPRCSRPTRVRHQRLEGEHARSVRVCSHCGEQLEVGK